MNSLTLQNPNNPMVSASQAAKEILRRRNARRHMADFMLYVNPSYQMQWFHRVLCEHLDRFARREIKNLMVYKPPQHGKSELVSRKLPAFICGLYPDAKIIAASYAAELIQGMNRDVQRTMESNEYRRLFPETQLNSKNIRTIAGSYLRNNDIFEIVGHKGQYRCAGVGGGLTGMPCDFGIIDDPLKDYKEAMSETIRNAVWEWYTSVFLTRTHKGSGKLLTLTRWHEDDLAGRLLELEPQEWTVLKLPAICEDPNAPNEQRQEGEALWPDRFPTEELLKRKALNPRQFEALYQQNPRPREGAMFDRTWFKVVPSAPKQAKRVRYWDKAGSDGTGARTAGVLIAMDDEKHFYVEDVIKGQWDAVKREKVIQQTAEADSAAHNGLVQIWVEQEPGSGGKESAESTVRNLAGHLIYAEKVSGKEGGKEARAEPFQIQAAARNVSVVAAEWNREYFDELESFPFGKFKDQVDASSGAFNKLAIAGEFFFI